LKTIISRQEFISKLRNLGFNGPFVGGKHQFMIKGNLKLHIPNPHKSKDIHIGLLKEILSQADISESEWEKA